VHSMISEGEVTGLPAKSWVHAAAAAAAANSVQHSTSHVRACTRGSFRVDSEVDLIRRLLHTKE
jgi:hypothetical protein